MTLHTARSDCYPRINDIAIATRPEGHAVVGVALGADESVSVVGAVPHQVLHHAVHVGTVPRQDGAGDGGTRSGTEAHACRGAEKVRLHDVIASVLGGVYYSRQDTLEGSTWC